MNFTHAGELHLQRAVLAMRRAHADGLDSLPECAAFCAHHSVRLVFVPVTLADDVSAGYL